MRRSSTVVALIICAVAISVPLLRRVLLTTHDGRSPGADATPSALIPIASVAPFPRNTEAFTLSDLDDVPADKTLLSDSVDGETWYFVPSWSFRGSAAAEEPTRLFDYRERPRYEVPRFRYKSPFAVLDNRSLRWKSVAISGHAYEIYPVRHDPVDPSLIWFGCNDARGQNIDWFGFRPRGDVDDPLVFHSAPGGLGLIDTVHRTVTYFGPYRDLVRNRVNALWFEKDAVWEWGSDGALGLNGIARFDRSTRTFEPFPIESHRYGNGWHNLTLRASDTAVSISLLEGGESFNRYEFNKARRQWEHPRYGWVSNAAVTLFAQPDDQSATIQVLPPGWHAGKQGHDHYGHPIVILEDAGGWQRVITCQDIVGWVKREALSSTMDFFRARLTRSTPRRNFGNEGPNLFLYMSRDEIQSAVTLIQGRAATSDLRGFTDSALRGLKDGDEMWTGFAERRQSLR